MKDKKIKRIPSGLANYELLVQQNCYYVDKTIFLSTVEEFGNYLFFIRPRHSVKAPYIKKKGTGNNVTITADQILPLGFSLLHSRR